MIFNGRKIKDITGVRSGRLVAIRPVSPKNRYGDFNTRQILWECKCECGEVSIQRSTKMSRGERKSCGCLSIHGRNGVARGHKINPCVKMGIQGKIPWWYYGKVKSRSRYDDIPFDISIDFLNELYEKQNGKCVLSGRDLTFGYGVNPGSRTTASLDRIDSSQGYVRNNVQWIHKKLNMMKKRKSDERFVKECIDTWELIRDVAMWSGRKTI